jgi:hypothetical protein
MQKKKSCAMHGSEEDACELRAVKLEAYAFPTQQTLRCGNACFAASRNTGCAYCRKHTSALRQSICFCDAPKPINSAIRQRRYKAVLRHSLLRTIYY